MLSGLNLSAKLAHTLYFSHPSPQKMFYLCVFKWLNLLCCSSGFQEEYCNSEFPAWASFQFYLSLGNNSALLSAQSYSALHQAAPIKV